MIDQCNICGGTVRELHQIKFRDILGMASEYTQLIGYCEKCGFAFTKNPFSAEQLKDRYSNFSKFEYDSEHHITQEDGGYQKRSMRQKQFIYLHKNTFQNVLDIGASSGYNLSLYDECKTFGIEPSALNCKLAKQHYNVDLFCGTFEEYWESDIPKDHFDLIILSHVLEHIVNPFDFIQKCRKINNQYMYIEVPTFDYKFVDEPYGMFAEEHVNYFTFQGLRSLMNAAGYCLVDANILFEHHNYLPAGYPALSTIWEVSGRPEILQESVLNSETLIQHYLKAGEKSFQRVKDKIDRISPNKRLAVWGTGHHASMILANTTLRNKNIVKFYDSDERKHSFQMNGCPIESFCTEDIKTGKVQAILVATYTAQQAIANILSPYENQCEIIYLYDI